MAFIALSLFGVAVAAGIGTLPWTINSEIYSAEARGDRISMVTVINWSMNFAMCASFLVLIDTIGGPMLFSMYSAVAAIFFMFFYTYLPETKGKTLEDVVNTFKKMWGEAKMDDNAHLKIPLIVQSFLMASIIIGVFIFLIWRVFQL